MTSGSFYLYYVDSDNKTIACAGVRYRIMRVSDGVQIVDGTTTDLGRTLAVTPNSFGNPAGGWSTTPAPSRSPLDNLQPVLAYTTVRYRLQVWNPVARSWVEPPLHPSQRAADMVIESGKGFDATAHIHPLRIMPCVNVLLRMKADLKGIANAPFVAYRRGGDGKEIVALDSRGQPIRGTTRADGSTGLIQCVDKVVFHFDWPVPGIKQITRSLSPLIPGGNLWIYTFDMRSVSATTAPQQGATGEVNGKKTAPAVLNAEREEMILLDSAAWQEFEAISSEVEGAFSGVHIAKGNLSAALAGRSVDEVRAAEAALGLAEDRVAKMLNKDFSKKADLQEVITFESYDKGRSAGDGGFADRMGMKRRYIPRAKYEELKQRRIKGVPIKVDLKAAVKVQSSGPGGTSGNASSQAKHDPVNKDNFDRDAFVNSLKKITVAGKKEWKTDPWVWDMIDAGGNEFSSAVQHSDSFSTESSAQWLRCVAGAGASAAFNWDRTKGRVGGVVQGSAQAKLVLFEGKYVMSYAIPSVKGWQMNFAGQDLGAIVFVLACELYGFVGAKAALTGSIGVSVSGGKASVKPLERDRNDSLAGAYDQRTGMPRASLDNNERIVPGALNESVPKESEMTGMGLKAEAFAGAEAGLQPSGDLKWLPPEQRTPVSFAKLSLDVAVSAGAGASGQLFVYYASGKFRVKASARLCWGVGAKGALDFVVDVGNSIELVKWVYYQLAHAGFKVLTYIAEEAFSVLSQILYMLIFQGLGLEETRLSRVFLATTVEIKRLFDQLNASLSRAEQRELMARNINKKPVWLIYATPETRGMLLYQLTRHDLASHAYSTPSVSVLTTDPQIHYMDANKAAIINVFKCVRTVSEWSNVLQHMTASGNKAGDAGAAEGDVLRFLNYGLSLTDDIEGDVFDVLNSGREIKSVGNRYIEDYAKHRARLLGQYPKGYEVASLDLMDSQMLAQVDGIVSPTFAVMDDSDSWLGSDQRRIMLAMTETEHGMRGPMTA